MAWLSLFIGVSNWSSAMKWSQTCLHVTGWFGMRPVQLDASGMCETCIVGHTWCKTCAGRCFTRNSRKPARPKEWGWWEGVIVGEGVSGWVTTMGDKGWCVWGSEGVMVLWKGCGACCGEGRCGGPVRRGSRTHLCLFLCESGRTDGTGRNKRAI